MYFGGTKIYSKKESSVCEIVKKEKGSCACFAVALQTTKVMAIVPDKCLVKMETALHLWMEDTNRNMSQLTATCCTRKL